MSRPGHRALPILTAMLLTLAGCSRTPATLAPHQIHIGGSSAGFAFSTWAAERLIREDAHALAPLVRAGGSGDGIRRFCDGSSVLHPDLVLTIRRPDAVERSACAAHRIGPVDSVAIGRTAWVVVTAKDDPLPGLDRVDVARAIADPAMRSWSQVDPHLPDRAIRIEGPAADSAIGDGLSLFVPPGTAIRRDGAYQGHGASGALIVKAVADHPGAIGIIPYPQATGPAMPLGTVPLDGVAPTAAAIASGRYPASAPLYLLVKRRDVGITPALPRLLDLFADALAAGGAFEQRGLVPLPPAKRDAAIAELHALARP